MSSSTVMLWSGLAIGPLAWFLSLEANFAFAPLACSSRGKALIYAVSGIAFALTVLGGSLSWIQHEQLRTESGIEFRTRKMGMAMSGIILSVLSALTILAQAIPNFMLRGCE
jgi:hypothetical protein